MADFLKEKVDVETGKKPSAKAICMVAPLGSDATMTALDLGIEAERTVAVDTLFGLEGRRTLMTTSVTDDAVRGGTKEESKGLADGEFAGFAHERWSLRTRESPLAVVFLEHRCHCVDVLFV